VMMDVIPKCKSKDDKKILSSFQIMKILATKGKRNQILFSKSIEHTLQCTSS